MQQILGANELSLDTIGIAQHHDAISGTARRRVVADYLLRINSTISINQSLYGKHIGSIFHWLNKEWKPSVQMEENQDVIVHNPSPIALNGCKIQVLEAGVYQV